MKNYAIKEHHLYNKAFRGGSRFVCKTVAVYVLRDYAAKRLMRANPEKKYLNRVGLSVGKKLGGAVVRNRVRRRLREVYRLNEAAFTPGWDIVVVARSRALEAKFSTLTEAYLTAARKAGILCRQEDAT